MHLSRPQKETMRLTSEEAQAISEVFTEIVKAAPARLWLFGSRTDLKKRGGDIDLFLELHASVDNMAALVRKIRTALYDRIGERKIDLIIKTPTTPPSVLHEIARQEGVLLWERLQT